jgi:hypothetical protein
MVCRGRRTTPDPSPLRLAQDDILLGDVISSTSGLVDWNERETRLGLTLFTINETRWTNQNGELVKVKRSTGIRY